MVLCMLVMMSINVLARDYGSNKAKIPVKWTVEPYFHFFLRINDANGGQIDSIRYENNDRIEGNNNWLDTFDLGSVSPEDRHSGREVGVGDYGDDQHTLNSSDYPNLWIEISSNDNWRIDFKKPRLINKTQDRWTEPVDLYTYYYGFDQTQDTDDKEPGWSSGGWINNELSVIRGDLGYHVTYFFFGMDYENLKTRYGTYKTTLTYTAYQY